MKRYRFAQKYSVWCLMVGGILIGWGCGRDPGTTQPQGSSASSHTIDFSKDAYPDFVKDVEGLSVTESWGGRFTDANLAPTAKVHFTQPLPDKFVLLITTGASGPNLNKPVKVKVGQAEAQFVVAEEWKPQTFRLQIELTSPADTIEIEPPNPTSPASAGTQGGDTRKLGLSLRALQIEQ